MKVISCVVGLTFSALTLSCGTPAESTKVNLNESKGSIKLALFYGSLHDNLLVQVDQENHVSIYTAEILESPQPENMTLVYSSELTAKEVSMLDSAIQSRAEQSEAPVHCPFSLATPRSYSGDVKVATADGMKWLFKKTGDKDVSVNNGVYSYQHAAIYPQLADVVTVLDRHLSDSEADLDAEALKEGLACKM